MDVQEFYDLVKSPPKDLIDDYPWLKKILADPTVPAHPTLEGFLWPASYKVLPDTTPEELVRLMLDKFYATVGADRLDVAKERGLSFYQVLALASIVEREAVLDDERAKIAGVYQNRIDGLPGIKNKILNADPTVIWANDTLELDKLDFDMWQKYSFWSPPDVPMKEVVVPEELAGYQTYLNPGLIPGPIATPTLALDRCGPRARHRGQVPLLRRDPRRRRRARVRQGQRGLPEAPQGVRLHMSGRLPEPADFAPAPTDRAARPPGRRRTGPPGPLGWRGCGRASRRRASTPTSASGREHTRYLTGPRVRRRRGEGGGDVRPVPGRRRRARCVLADSRYTIQAAPRGARRARRRGVPRPAEPLAGAGRLGRGAAGRASRPASSRTRRGARLAAAAPDVELVPVEGWVEADRATKEPAELERIAAACAVADRALAALLPEIRTGVDRGGRWRCGSSG